MPYATINIWAVIAAAVVNMVVGAAWYSPLLFSKPWSRLVGKKRSDLQKQANVGYAFAMAAALIEAFVLAHFVDYFGADSIRTGLLVGFCVWIGFVATTMGANYVFAQRPRKLFMIDAGYHLTVLLINGVILALWP